MKIEIVDKKITTWGGIAILKMMLESLSFAEQLERCPLPPQGSNRGYDPAQLIHQFFASVLCGANRYQYAEVMRF